MASSSRQKSGSSGSNNPRKQKREKAPHPHPHGTGSRGNASPSPRRNVVHIDPKAVKAAKAAKPASAASGSDRTLQPRRAHKAHKSSVHTPSARGRQASQRARADISARSIGDINRDKRARAREESMKRAIAKTRRPFIIVTIILALILAVAIAFIALSRTDTFKIEEVEYTGISHLTQEEVAALNPMAGGMNLLNVDEKAIEANLVRDAWVKSVNIVRHFPHKLQIDVEERDIAAIVEIPMGTSQTLQSWAISSDAVWIMAVPNKDSDIGSKLSQAIYDDVENAIHIVGVPYGTTPEIGAKCTDENINNALKIITGLTTSLSDQVKTVEATDPSSTIITLRSNVEIAFGNADNIREKERICLEVMEKNPTVVYINVRVPDRPTWKGTRS